MRLRYNAPLTLSYAIVAVVVFVLGARIYGEVFSLKFAVAADMDYADPWSYFRLLSHVLGHFDLQHLSSNMLLLLLLGPLLEEKYGSVQLLGMAAVTALVTGLIHASVFSGLLLGASGVVFMFITLSSFGNRRAGELPLTMIFVVVAYLGSELLAVGNDDNVSRMAHIAGGVIGVFFGFLHKSE